MDYMDMEFFPLYEPLGSPGGSASGTVLGGLVAALAALALAMSAFFFSYVDCVPLDIGTTTALLEVELNNLEEGQEVSWVLMTGSNIIELPPLDNDDLTKLLEDLTTLLLTQLEPDTEYTIVFTTPGEDGQPDIIHTFTFRTGKEPGSEPPDLPPPPNDDDPPPVTTTETTAETTTETTAETTTETAEETTEETTTETTLPRPPGGGGGEESGGSSVTPPHVLSPDFEFTESDGYFILFPFTLNGATPTGAEVRGTLYKRNSWDDPVSSESLVHPVAVGDIDTYGDDAYVSYRVPTAYWGADLYAVLHYKDTNGNSGSVKSPAAYYTPPFFYNGGGNTLTATLSEGMVNCTMTVNDYQPGSDLLNFQIGSIQYRNTSNSLAYVDDYSVNGSGPFTLTFSIDPANLPTSGDLYVAVTGITGIYPSPTSATTPIDLPAFITSPPVTASIESITGPTTLSSLNNMQCTSVAFAPSSGQIAEGAEVTMYLNFTALDAAGSSAHFLLTPNVTSGTLDILSLGSAEVRPGDTSATVTVTFRMPGRNVTEGDFQFADFGATDLSATP